MSLDVRDILLALLGVVSAVYLYGRWGMTFFTRRGVRSMPASPFVGHMGYVVKKTEHLRDTIQRLYKTYPDEKYVGLYDFSRPTLLVKDPELIKKMTIKDFDHFQDHTQRVSPEANPLLATSLFFLQGQRWRDMRPRLSPAFTSSKMKHMLEFITECTEKLSEFYLKEVQRPENADKGMVELELKDVLTRYTNDVIGTCAFGLKVNSLDDRDNEFYTMGRDLTTFGGVTMVIKMLFFNMFPALMQWLKISMLREEITKFFTDLVLGTMRRREQEKIIRPDMIHLLMEARKGDLVYKETEATKDVGFSTVDESAIGKVAHKKTHWTDVELVSQAAIFFIAGFETSSTLLCFMCHEVATRPEIQRRLQEEVDEVAATNEGKVTYADLQNMKYLDMVVSETLRFWPPVPKLDRMCVKSYKLPPSSPGAKPYTVLPKESLWFPVYAIHHDPKYYEDPETFDPERFSDENKSKIDASTYMPFGIGPRNCIGSRFALMEAKALIFQLLLKFDLVRTSKTQVPMRIKTNQHFITAENGFWVGLKPRNKSK